MALTRAKKDIRSLQREMKRELTRAAGATVGKVRAKAVERSSGPFTQKQLAAKDHPYAARHPAPLLDPSLINSQRGVFRSAWDEDLPRVSDTRIAGKVFNMSDVADFLQFGTATMVRRPIAGTLSTYALMEGEKEVLAALKRIERA